MLMKSNIVLVISGFPCGLAVVRSPLNVTKFIHLLRLGEWRGDFCMTGMNGKLGAAFRSLRE